MKSFALLVGWILLMLPSVAQIQTQGSFRLRYDLWDWFSTPNFQDNYVYSHSLLKLGFQGKVEKDNYMVELAAPYIYAVPSHASAPNPQGRLGDGGSVKAANGNGKGSVFIKQAYYEFNRDSLRARIGRQEFQDGLELSAKDSNLNWIRQNRLGQRHLGANRFSLSQRHYDGLLLQHTQRGRWTLYLAYPVEGGAELDANRALTRVNIGYLSYMQTRDSAKEAQTSKIYSVFYQDARGLAKADNSGSAGTSDIKIWTVGGDWSQVWKRKEAKIDALARFGLQTGSWGSHRHTAHAYGVEAGAQWTNQPWKPWLRVGYSHGSGDKNSRDNKHETWFPGMPSGSLHARTPFYNLMNLEDTFIQLMLSPTPKLSARIEYHSLRLDERADRWYSGSGPSDNRSFGVTGRPSNGARKLADMFDVSLTYTFSPQWQISAYKSWIRSGGVARGVYPTGKGAGLFFVETSYRW